MKKRIFGKKLSRNTNERKQLFRNIIKAVVTYNAITTSRAKADAVRPQLEQLITLAKKKDLASYKRLIQECGDIKVARKLKALGELFKLRPGGYTRIIRSAPSEGNNGPQVRFELVEKIVEAEEVVIDKKSNVKKEKQSSAKKVRVKDMKKNEKVRVKKITK